MEWPRKNDIVVFKSGEFQLRGIVQQLDYVTGSLVTSVYWKGETIEVTTTIKDVVYFYSQDMLTAYKDFCVENANIEVSLRDFITVAQFFKDNPYAK